jgi:polyhydroxybutyrate depolymerase
MPAKLGSSVPLVLSFHGHFGTAREQAEVTGFDALSDRYGFIVVYPEGIERSWNDGRPQDAGSDDVGFVKALIADLSARYPLDPKRIYATGFSNGGSFSEYLGCTLAAQIAAIAPVSGYLPVDDVGVCRPARAISVLAFGGTADPVEPYAGAHVMMGPIDRGYVLSAEATATFWSKNAKCAPTPTVSTLAAADPAEPDDPTSVTSTAYTGCVDGTDVVLDTIAGGGHRWPGGPRSLLPSAAGIATRRIDGSAAIVEFFFAHPMR